MSGHLVSELENIFVKDVGVPRLDFYRLLEQDTRRLLDIVEGRGDYTQPQRALASRALAYVVQGSDAVPDNQILGHVDDYVVVLVAHDELFPDEVSPLGAEALMQSLPQDARERLVRAIDLVTGSNDSFPVAALRGPVGKSLEQFRVLRGESRDLATLARTYLPQIFGSALAELFTPKDEDGKRFHPGMGWGWGLLMAIAGLLLAVLFYRFAGSAGR